MTIRERYVWVCTNRRPDGSPRGSCAQKGSEALRDKLKTACNAAGLARSVRVMSSSCIDECEHGIVVAVMPEGAVLGDLDESHIPALVEGLKTAGGILSEGTVGGHVIPRENPISTDEKR